MARISKKRKETRMRPRKIYSAGIYARLSTDSGERKNESIETQIEIAKNFIGRRDDMELYDIYTDIGKTGTNFEREGFERMMGDVRLQKIDCIVVKDLSRFGRNHIEAGNYIEKIFPFMGVRFIAVTDHFDSMDISGQNDVMGVNMDIVLKNLINEMYARDIAAKVRAVRRAKQEQGSYTGGTAPYGYRVEWVGDKRCLFIEEKAADIVRKIFELFLSGRNRKEIMVWLYENKVVRPAVYRKTGQVCWQEEEGLEQWSKGTIKRILQNPVYTGYLVQGRAHGKEHRSHGGHAVDPKDWPAEEHTHEAIISEELFLKAAEKFEESSRQCNRDGDAADPFREEDVFAGILYCGECGAKMKRVSSARECASKDKVRIYSYKCPGSGRIDGLKCAGKSIPLCSLTGIVKEVVRREFALSGIRPKDLVEMNRRETEMWKKKWGKELAMFDRRLEKIRTLGSEQYLRYRMGETEEACYKREKEINDKNAVSVREESRAVAEKLRAMDSEAAGKNHFLRALMKGGGKGELTSEIVRTLIERIEIYPEHRVKVTFAFGRGAMPAGSGDCSV